MKIIYVSLPNNSESHSVMSNSLQPHGVYSPWNSPEYWSGFPSGFQGVLLISNKTSNFH